MRIYIYIYSVCVAIVNLGVAPNLLLKWYIPIVRNLNLEDSLPFEVNLRKTVKVKQCGNVHNVHNVIPKIGKWCFNIHHQKSSPSMCFQQIRGVGIPFTWGVGYFGLDSD